MVMVVVMAGMLWRCGDDGGNVMAMVMMIAGLLVVVMMMAGLLLVVMMMTEMLLAMVVMMAGMLLAMVVIVKVQNTTYKPCFSNNHLYSFSRISAQSKC